MFIKLMRLAVKDENGRVQNCMECHFRYLNQSFNQGGCELDITAQIETGRKHKAANLLD